MTATTVSLFCGAGGESLGKHAALRELGLEDATLISHAVNHWDLAVQAHGINLPNVLVHQEDITQVSAATYGLTRIQLLWASPSCVHHSRARGGKPREDQQRSHAWEVTDRWLRVAQVDVLLIENVPEFEEWGPLNEDGQPIQSRKGEAFQAWVADLRSLGYEVDWRVLCAADFGAPTTRRRFFLQAVKDGKGIHWPEPSHRDPRKPAGLFDAALPPWRTAAECIDWSIPCPSIFDRKKPLAEATLRRIAAGVVRYVVEARRPFLVNLTHGGRLEDLDEPFKTITGANRGEKALVVPSLVGVGGRAGQSGPRGADEPMHTATTKADTALVAASMVSLRGTSPEQIKGSSGSVEEPVRTISAGGGHAAVVAAFLAKHYTGVVGSSVEQPMPTVTATDHNALVAASLVQMCYGERDGQAPRALDIEQPLGTVVAGGIKHGLVAAHMMSIDQQSTGASASRGADEPISTATTKARHALVAAFISHYYGQGTTAQDPGQPLHTITTLARHGLVTVEIDGETYIITDIGMRMLEPKELAAAMGFPEWYRWVMAGGAPLTKRDQVKMIGNAVPPPLAKALVLAVAGPRPELFGLKERIA
ncbi:DNA cytosine methyltransferase [Geothrix sp. 21YS21S-2]|uniref:DNA cytosine methyltransferase n=1 Tax=Geothrix sp. 21YS21S-2 TaxID=3068893 RepID=UPI0027B8E15F|nr:DNA cytosine methyltransferase [Geothrix sp. 21YS21S-2]